MFSSRSYKHRKLKQPIFWRNGEYLFPYRKRKQRESDCFTRSPSLRYGDGLWSPRDSKKEQKGYTHVVTVHTFLFQLFPSSVFLAMKSTQHQTLPSPSTPHSSKHYENQTDRASERGSRKISALLPGQTKCFVMRLAISSLLPSLSWPSAIRTPTERMGGERMGIFERANRTIQLPTAANVNRCMHLLCCVVGARELRASFIV